MAEDIPAIPGTPDHQQGFNDLVIDSDGVVRRDLVHVSNQIRSIRSLSIRAVETANQKQDVDKKIEALPSNIWLSRNSGGYLNLPSAGYQTMLDTNRLESIPKYSLNEILSRTINPVDIASNLKKGGVAIPGVRPGGATSNYLSGVQNRLTLLGGLFLGSVAIVPSAVERATNVQTFQGLGATSLLILVGVAIDTSKQIQTYVISQRYEGLVRE